MSYKVNWGFDLSEQIIEEISESPKNWTHACFATLTEKESQFFDTITCKYSFGKRFYVFFWNNNPEIGKDIQSPMWDSDVRFTRLVNYWLHIGRCLGLALDDVTWGRNKEKETLWFSFPTDFLKERYKTNKIKVLQMHLFFLRLLLERNGTVGNVIRLRCSLQRKFPQISTTTVVIAMEALWSASLLKETKWSARHSYKKEGHYLFARIGLQSNRLVKASIQPNIMKELRQTEVRYFDNDLYKMPEVQSKDIRVLGSIQINHTEIFKFINEEVTKFVTHLKSERKKHE